MRTYIRGPKGHSATTKHKRYECFFLRRRRSSQTPRHNHDERRILRYHSRRLSPTRQPGGIALSCSGHDGSSNRGIDTTTSWSNTSVSHFPQLDQAIKNLIIEAFDDAYLDALSDEVVGYASCTSLDILTHLLTHYALILPTELTQNYERLNTLYDPNQPIKMLFRQIQDAQAFAVAGGQPYGAAMIINVAYTLVFNTVLYPDACHAWRSRALAAKTWAQFKIDFSTAHR
jgi:hypothetical protein